MINELEIIDLIAINFIVLIIFFTPLISIVDHKKKSLEEVKRVTQREYRGIRFLITIYLLLMLSLLLYLFTLLVDNHKAINILMMTFTFIIIVRVLMFDSRDYDT